MKFYQKTWFKAVVAIFLIWLVHGMIAAWPAEQEKAKQEVAAKPEAKTEQKATEKKALKFDKAIADATAELKNREFNKFTRDVSIKVDEKEKVVSLMAVMDNGLKKWVAMEFADTMIRRFSSFVAMYNDGVTGPSNDNYGSLFDEYKIQIGIAPAAQVDNPDNWYYMQWIYPKMHTKQGPDWKKAQRESK